MSSRFTAHGPLSTVALTLPAAAVLLIWAGDGFAVWFSGDDLMNLHGHWMTRWPDLLGQLVWPSTEAYRPLGGLVYRSLFALFGLEPAAWRVVCFGLLLTNLALACSLIRRLTGSATAAAASTAALAYHASMADLYYNGGTLYELLCFGFVLAAVHAYVRADAERVKVSQVAAVVGLTLAAWGAKEMAACLPLLLLAWEVTRAGGLGKWKRWTSRTVSLAAVTAVSMGFALSKMAAANPLQEVGAYRPTVSWEAWAGSTAHYFDQLFYQAGFFTPTSVLVVFAGLAAAAAILRRAEARFAAAWIVASALPIAFIAPRSGFAYYLPSFGWALLFASAWAASPARRWNPWLAAAIVGAALAPAHWRERDAARGSVVAGVEAGRAVSDAVAPSREELCAAAAVVIRGDVLPPESTLFYVRLLCRDRGLLVRRTPSAARKDEALLAFPAGRPAVHPARLTAAVQAVEFRIEPAAVEPGGVYVVEAPEFAGQRVDVGYRGGSGWFTRIGVVEGFCTLDDEGRAEVRVPAGQPLGLTTVTHVRGETGGWRRTAARVRVR